MPYQDRHPVEPQFDAASPVPAASELQETGSNAKTIQVIIVIGLIAAILVAIFGAF